jgi:hypothetical protein
MAAERVVSKYAQEKSKNRFEELCFFVVSGKYFSKKGNKTPQFVSIGVDNPKVMEEKKEEFSGLFFLT